MIKYKWGNFDPERVLDTILTNAIGFIDTFSFGLFLLFYGSLKTHYKLKEDENN